MTSIPSDIEIARTSPMQPIGEIAAAIGLRDDEYELRGRWVAKLERETCARLMDAPPSGQLVLVTAMSPTPAGEGKTTVSVGLADSLRALGARTLLCLREPSLGPCFGMKGGAAGGGYAQVLPMQDINLHFTGDFHAIGLANNLLAAVLDNHLHQGNALGLDPRRISWTRVVDMNDRSLRQTVVGLGGPLHGVPRSDGFQITVASEVMACLCLCTDLADLKRRLGNIVVGETHDRRLVRACDLRVHGAMAALLVDAVRPNLVQTIEHTPAFVHGGPFANIAHGANSIRATRCALGLADYVVTEAGFGSDLGAEKFVDIVCRAGGFAPRVAVVVATIRALKHHGGASREGREDLDAIQAGFANLERHVDNVRRFGIAPVVSLNCFGTDTSEEIELVIERCASLGVRAVETRVWESGSKGGRELAEAVLEASDEALAGEPRFSPLYGDALPLHEKIERVARQVYGAGAIVIEPRARRKLEAFQRDGFGRLPVCMAKTQYSFSADPRMLGAPSGFDLPVRDVRLAAGAEFVVVYCGDVMTMPGLPRVPAAEQIDVDEDGNITGLF